VNDVKRAIKILVVDDYHDAVEMWAIFLRALGYDVLTSEDGVEALHMAQTTMPDIVVLDLELPGMNGAEVARRLRESPDTAHIPLIAASGHSGHAELEAARAAGFDRGPDEGDQGGARERGTWPVDPSPKRIAGLGDDLEPDRYR
jgi:CheY-like chemotaxis protein